MRIEQCFAADCDEVGTIVADDGFSEGRRRDKADRDGSDAGLLADTLGIRHLIAFLPSDHFGGSAFTEAARGAVDEIDSDGFQGARQHDAVFEIPAAGLIVDARYPDRQW